MNTDWRKSTLTLIKKTSTQPLHLSSIESFAYTFDSYEGNFKICVVVSNLILYSMILTNVKSWQTGHKTIFCLKFDCEIVHNVKIFVVSQVRKTTK